MPPPRKTSPDSQAGFTIIETMVACMLLLVGMVATLTIVDQANSTTVKTRTREQATNLQRELVEAARSVSYDELTPNGLSTAVSARPALGDASVGTSGWTIRRRNATYTVSMGVCTVDDTRDGTGPHEANVFCPAAGATSPTPEQCANLINATVPGKLPGADVTGDANAGLCGIDANLDGTVDGLATVTATVCLALLSPCSASPDTNPADYKRIVSLVRWPGGYNLQTSQVNNPGLAAAPAVTSLTAEPNTITDATQISLGLTSTTTNTPSTVALYRDGTAIGTASSTGGANWAATWNLGPVTTTAGGQPTDSETVDGSYQLSEKAFDQYGQYGATRSQTVVVNRRQHFAPARVAVGRNGTGVEIEWSPAKERDSEGFRVDRRVNDGDWKEVCPRATRTGCFDNDKVPPPPGLLQTLKLEYSVVGYDRDPDSKLPRPGDRSKVMRIADPPPAVPNTPGSFQASLVGGNVVLTWTAPSSGLLGSAPDHYNVYRVAQGAAEPSYADRLDSVYVEPGQSLTYTDTRTTGQVHDYWITAVNSQLGESEKKLGPVRR
ncbi:MAG: prepilin-type N-terminal cleavage/methylation domain-containing protein [Actinomycetota bacterium]|nr:prepilin-type N-terminal cleavage/methylation domain-containing protein [Actinomycetota bacterium]